MTPSTLYQLAGVPEDVPVELVRSAALVEGGGTGEGTSAALAVLADQAARADYDSRSSQGLGFELALAWGVAALATGDPCSAHVHFERAQRIAPDSSAVRMLLQAIPEDASPLPMAAESARAPARREIERLRNNSAFPHRLIRYAAALAGNTSDAGAKEPDVLAHAARELLQYDVAEAPRSYAMVLPVLREHYPAAYALDAPFFDATSAVLADHAPAAEYERGKRLHRETGGASVPAPTPPPLDLGGVKLPPLNIPDRRLNLSGLPRTGYSWVGGVIGGILAIDTENPLAIVGGAVIGFCLFYAVLLLLKRR